MKTIEIKEEFKLPGTDIVLESGDKISILKEANLTKNEWYYDPRDDSMSGTQTLSQDLPNDDDAVYIAYDSSDRTFQVIPSAINNPMDFEEFGDLDDILDYASKTRGFPKLTASDFMPFFK